MHTVLRPSRLTSRYVGPDSIREVVFGVEDGVVQNMTLVAGMVGARLTPGVITLAAAINGIAGVLSMSMGTYLSSKAERDVARARPGSAGASHRSPTKDAAVMAAAYAVGSFVPIVPFLFGVTQLGLAVGLAVALAAATLFGLGVLKADLSNQRRVRAGLEMLALAAAAGVAGFLIGIVARAFFGLDA